MSELFENIPLDLREQPQWLVWRYETRGGRKTKVPYAPGASKPVDATAEGSWSTFTEVVETEATYSGIGFALSEADPFCGIDLDHCIIDGDVAPAAREIVTRLASYTEITPSGEGLRIWIRAKLPGPGNRRHWQGLDVEIYDHGRYLTVTGDHLAESPWGVMDRQEELDDLHAELWPKEIEEHREPQRPPDMDDQAIVDKMFASKVGSKVKDLWHGNIDAYDGDDSRADYALAWHIAFYTQNPEQIERIMRCSCLNRPKWDKHPSYMQRTIGRAVARKTETYGSNASPPSPEQSEKADMQYEGNRAEGAPEEEAVEIYNLSDLGNAERLVHKHGDHLRYLHNAREWLVWQKTRWQVDSSGHIERRAVDVVRDIYGEARACEDKDHRKRIAKWARESEGNNRVKAMVDLARSQLPVSQEELDADPWLLNCRNGILDLRNGTLREHDPRDMLTRQIPVDYDPEADQTIWLKFLTEATAGDEELMGFLQRAAGYSLTGQTTEEVLFFVHGPGAAGKSTFVEALRSMLGDYGATLNFEVLLAKSGGDGGRGPNPELVKLTGVRFAASIEVDEGKKLAEGIVKSLTGGDTVSARAMYARRSIEFKPQFKLWLVANDAPRVRENDDALWRRILRCPFEQIVPAAKRDKTLKERLRDPRIGGAAVLAWAVQGCLMWQKGGLCVPEAVRASTEELRQEMDPLTGFLAERCQFSETAYTSNSELRQNYESWCRENGHHPVSPKRFGDSLRRAGCQTTVSHSVRGWFGITILGTDDPYPGTDRNGQIRAQGTEGTDTHVNFSHGSSHVDSLPNHPYHPYLPYPDAENGSEGSVEQSVTVRKMPDGGIVRYLPDGSVEI